MEETATPSLWASRRKAVYLGLIVLVFTGFSFFIFSKFWYTGPTCTDRTQNGDEEGIDCGGSCQNICTTGLITPIVRWDPRLFEITPGVWSAIVYVENPNVSVVAAYVPYTLTIYDEKNTVIAERSGATVLPNRKTVGVFEGSIRLETPPKKAVFEISGDIVWKKTDPERETDISISHSPILRVTSAPRVEAVVKNDGLDRVKNLELVIAVFDSDDNAIAASRTFVENLGKGESTNVFFTWPKPFDLGKIACEKPSSVVLALDRSGSMTSISENPPEPLTSVKTSAAHFIAQLKEGDMAGVIPFATEALSIPEFSLTKNLILLQDYISNISILKDGTQYTNIADALAKSLEALYRDDRVEAKKVLVLLTDGVANRPQNPAGSRNETEEVAFAEKIAEEAASIIKQSGATIYTIGLGKDIHQDFLKRVASSPANFFEAPSTTTLQEIYKNISTSICDEVPSRIEITYKILDVNVEGN